ERLYSIHVTSVTEEASSGCDWRNYYGSLYWKVSWRAVLDCLREFYPSLANDGTDVSKNFVDGPESSKKQTPAGQKRQRASEAMRELWPDGLPNVSLLTDKELVSKVQKWCEGKRVVPPSRDTILRAAKRRPSKQRN